MGNPRVDTLLSSFRIAVPFGGHTTWNFELFFPRNGTRASVRVSDILVAFMTQAIKIQTLAKYNATIIFTRVFLVSTIVLSRPPLEAARVFTLPVKFPGNVMCVLRQLRIKYKFHRTFLLILSSAEHLLIPDAQV